MLDFSIAVQIFQYSEAGFFSVIAAELEEDRGDPEHPMIFKRVPDDIRWLLDKWFQMVPVKMLRRLKVERMRGAFLKKTPLRSKSQTTREVEGW